MGKTLIMCGGCCRELCVRGASKGLRLLGPGLAVQTLVKRGFAIRAALNNKLAIDGSDT